MCRGGRMFAPTKTWRRWHRRVNTTQKRYAICSALAASALPALVMSKGGNSASGNVCLQLCVAWAVSVVMWLVIHKEHSRVNSLLKSWSLVWFLLVEAKDLLSICSGTESTVWGRPTELCWNLTAVVTVPAYEIMNLISAVSDVVSFLNTQGINLEKRVQPRSVGNLVSCKILSRPPHWGDSRTSSGGWGQSWELQENQGSCSPP